MKNPETLRDTAIRPQGSWLGGVNERFHEQLEALAKEKRQEIASGKIPLVIRMDDRLVLRAGSKDCVTEITAEAYHQLKALAHLPVALFLQLKTDNDPATVFREYLAPLNELVGQTRELHIAADVVRRAADELLTAVENNHKQVDESAASAFNEALTPAFQMLVAAAASSEAAELLAAVQRYRDQVADADRWSRTYYVVCAGMQPRYKQLSRQLFERWVSWETNGDKVARHRVVYAEGVDSVDDAAERVVTRLVSGDVAATFLHSPLSLDEDVLGDAATQALDTLFDHLDRKGQAGAGDC